MKLENIVNFFSVPIFASKYGKLSLARAREVYPVLFSIARAKPGDRILDIGCAYGAGAICANRQYEVTGIEQSYLMYLRAKKTNLEFGGTTLLRSIEDTELPDHCMDAAVDSYCLFHVVFNRNERRIAKVADEIARILKPGACLVSYPYQKNDKSRFLYDLLRHRMGKPQFYGMADLRQAIVFQNND